MPLYMVSQLELNEQLIADTTRNQASNMTMEFHLQEKEMLLHEIGSLADWIQICSKKKSDCDPLLYQIKKDRRDEVIPLVNRYKGMAPELSIKMAREGMVRDGVVDEWRHNWPIHINNLWKTLKKSGYTNPLDEFDIYKRCRELLKGTREQCARAVDAVEDYFEDEGMDFPSINPFENDFDTAFEKHFGVIKK